MPTPSILTALLIGLTAFTVWSASIDELFPAKVVVQGDGFTLTDREIEAAFLQFKTTSAARGEQVTPSQEKALMISTRERLISEKLLFDKANDEDRKLGREATNKYLKQTKDKAGTQESYERQLRTLGMPAEIFEKKIYEKAVGDMVLARELKKDIVITEEQVNDFYQKNKTVFMRKEGATVAHILIMGVDLKTRKPLPQEQLMKKKAVANRLQERARSGEDFTKLVQAFSEDKASKENKGVYKFTRGQMLPTFEAAAFTMVPGQISDVVQTQYGYHIIKMIEKIESIQVPLEEVKEQIHANLEYNEFEKLLPPYLSKLSAASNVEVIE